MRARRAFASYSTKSILTSMTQQLVKTTWEEPLWIHQSFETEQEYQAFTSFKDLSPRLRCMQEVSRYTSISKEQLRALSQIHYWRDRIEAYDRFISMGKVSLLNARKDDRSASHLHVLDLSLEVITRELNNLLDRQRMCDAQGKGVSHLKPSELRALLRDTIRLERLIRGEVTERAEEQYDLSSFSTDELLMWKSLTTKAKTTRLKNIDKELDELDDDN